MARSDISAGCYVSKFALLTRLPRHLGRPIVLRISPSEDLLGKPRRVYPFLLRATMIARANSCSVPGTKPSLKPPLPASRTNALMLGIDSPTARSPLPSKSQGQNSWDECPRVWRQAIAWPEAIASRVVLNWYYWSRCSSTQQHELANVLVCFSAAATEKRDEGSSFYTSGIAQGSRSWQGLGLGP